MLSPYTTPGILTFGAAMLHMVSDPASPDLTARQMSALVEISRASEPQTVRGLAALLNVSKPAITRALNRLEELGLAERADDPSDRRSILLLRTKAGLAWLKRLDRGMARAAS